MKADLHVHTNKSDGIYSLSEIIPKAEKAGLKAVAITDHDSVASLPEIAECQKKTSVEIIPGIEISVYEDGGELHMLGYFVNHTNSELQYMISQVQNVRKQRVFDVCDKLQKININVLPEEVFAVAGDTSSLGRPHIAKVMLAKNYVSSLKEAFVKYLSAGNPGFVAKHKVSAAESIDIIKAAGGVAVLAHPFLNRQIRIIEPLIAKGISGLEVYYSMHTSEQVSTLRKIASKYNLIETGGSDYHGETHNSIRLGDGYTDYRNVEALKKLAGAEIDV